jgi:hypothetical protein
MLATEARGTTQKTRLILVDTVVWRNQLSNIRPDMRMSEPNSFFMAHASCTWSFNGALVMPNLFTVRSALACSAGE